MLCSPERKRRHDSCLHLRPIRAVMRRQRRRARAEEPKPRHAHQDSEVRADFLDLGLDPPGGASGAPQKTS
eukprot:5955899-Pyramimonas_sp.AAC.1